MDNEIGKRLENLLEIKGLQNNEFAKKINVGKTTVSNWIHSSNGIPLKHIYAIKKEFPDLNLNWLITGNGYVFMGSSENETPPPEQSKKAEQYVRLEAQVDLLKTLLKSREAECRELTYRIKKLRPPNNT